MSQTNPNIAFEDLADDKTQIAFIEKDWSVGQMMEMSKIGMAQCLDKMAKALKIQQRRT